MSQLSQSTGGSLPEPEHLPLLLLRAPRLFSQGSRQISFTLSSLGSSKEVSSTRENEWGIEKRPGM